MQEIIAKISYFFALLSVKVENAAKIDETEPKKLQIWVIAKAGKRWYNRGDDRYKGEIPLKIMAVDLGHARTGIAVSDIGERLASPVGTITEYVDERLLPKIADIAREQRAEMIVVGHPKNMDGSRGEAARRAEDIAAKLGEMTGLPVQLWDERMTTVSAIGYLNQTDVRGKKRKQVVDTVAATIILQDFLDSRK